MRYQAALRPEPLGSNTRTIASQPTIARSSFFFDDKFIRQRAPLSIIKIAASNFRARAVYHIDDVRRLHERIALPQQMTLNAPPQ